MDNQTKKKILLVEDDQALSQMYSDKFSHDGFEVLTALDGKDGIEKMREGKPDVVILDLLMPHVTGFEVLKMVKEDPELNKIPIIVLTNIFADAEDLIKNWGVTYFLLKANCIPQDVVNKVNQVLAAPKSS